MNFNIALNTIIYIMVFLFPGVLFRRFYFAGKFSKQFNQGNLLERFLWTLFCSVVALTIFGISFYWVNVNFNLELLHNVTFRTISNVLANLAKNNYPTEFQDEDSLLEFGMLLLIIYVFSALLGKFCHSLIRLLTIDKYLSTFKFSNDWVYLAEANSENGVSRKIGDVFLTYVDILTTQKDKEELYRGLFKDFLLDKDNKLENIVISQASKFIHINKDEANESKIMSLRKLVEEQPDLYSKHQEFDDKIVFNKIIKGNILILPATTATNINLTYIKLHNRLSRWKIITQNLTYFLFLIVFCMMILLQFVKLKNIYLDTFLEKLVFGISGILVMLFIVGTVRDALYVSHNRRKKVIENLLFMFLFSIPYLWVYEVFSWIVTLVIFTSYLFIIALISAKLDTTSE